MQTSEESVSKKKNGKAKHTAEELVDDVASSVLEEVRAPREPAQAVHVGVARVAIGDNYRKSIDFNYIESLSKTIVRDGQLEPILVRPAPGLSVEGALNGEGSKHGDPDFEIVFGECRWRAITSAELPTIWMYVRELTDLEVLELQLLENMKRADPHPLDEAEAFDKLRTKHGYSVERIAAKIEKPVAYVYEALKLCELAPEAREAFFARKLTKATAVMVARIPDVGLQAKAAVELGPNEAEGRHEPMPAREALELIHERYMLRLVDAPFDRKDTTLVEGVGGCGACPKRTGNQKQLFADLEAIEPKANDLCTDPTCFAAKRTAHIAREKERLEAKGVTVIVSKSRVDPYRGAPRAPSGYVTVKEFNYDAHKSYGELAAKAGKKVELDRAVMIGSDGKKTDLIAKTGVDALLKSAGVKQREEPKPVDPIVKAAHEAANKRACSKVVEHVLKKGGTDAVLRLIFRERLDAATEKEIQKLHGNRLVARVVQYEIEDDWNDRSLKAFCAEFDIDLKKMVAEELKAAELQRDAKEWTDDPEHQKKLVEEGLRASPRVAKKKPAKKAKAKSSKKPAKKK